MQFIDATYFLHFLTGDDPAKTKAATALFQRLGQDAEHATTTEAVVAEVVYLLSAKSPYHLSPEDIRSRLIPLLSLRGLRIPYKRMYLRALDVFATYPDLDFVDALSVALMEREGVSEILSCNTDFDQIPSIRRIKTTTATPHAA